MTTYLQERLSFVVFRVDDEPNRLALEPRLISTVSRCAECKPSDGWLGLSSPKQRIRESGLWVVNELYKEPLTQADFQRLETLLT